MDPRQGERKWWRGHPPPGNFNQKSVVAEKVLAKDGNKTRGSWKDQENQRETNWRGIEQAPKQGRGAPPTVRRELLEAKAEGVAAACRNMETEAPVSTRNLCPERESSRNTRLESPAGRA